jgi:hypothetical protein
MSLWRQLTYGLRSLTDRTTKDNDADDEVRQYFEETVAAWQAAASPPMTPGAPLASNWAT